MKGPVQMGGCATVRRDSGPTATPTSGSQGLRGLTSRADTWASPYRLFDLEPDLLPLFQYNCRQFSRPEDCLSSPEFLDHIRKVRVRQSGPWDPAEAFLGRTRDLGLDKLFLFSAPGLLSLPSFCFLMSGASAPFPLH